MAFKNFIAENLYLPIGDLLTGQSVYKKLKFLQKSQFWSREEIDRFQNERLRILIKEAYNNTAYYRELFDQHGIKPQDIQDKKDLVQLPVLKKVIIKNQGIERFTSMSISKSLVKKSSSSGSTGEPLFYFTTKDAYSMNLAANLRGWYGMGYRLGDKYIQLSQNSRKDLIKRLQDIINNNLFLATNPLIDSNFDYVFNKIETYRPKFIRSYPDPLLFLSHYKKNNPKFTYSPLAINTTGNTMHPETRSEIEKSFNCKIFDSYSCEGNSNVFECPTHSGYHSCEEYGISEILDDNNKVVTNGIGRLISTDLWNFAHPFIRYDTQDLVEVESSMCSCGRSLLRIKRILGRDSEVLTISSGRKFIVHNFTGFFQTDSPFINRSVDQFQVVKRRDNSILFRLVVNTNYNEGVKNYIRSFWEIEFKARVNIEVVDELPLLGNNKRKFIINE